MEIFERNSRISSAAAGGAAVCVFFFVKLSSLCWWECGGFFINFLLVFQLMVRRGTRVNEGRQCCAAECGFRERSGVGLLVLCLSARSIYDEAPRALIGRAGFRRIAERERGDDERECEILCASLFVSALFPISFLLGKEILIYEFVTLVEKDLIFLCGCFNGVPDSQCNIFTCKNKRFYLGNVLTSQNHVRIFSTITSV